MDQYPFHYDLPVGYLEPIPVNYIAQNGGYHRHFIIWVLSHVALFAKNCTQRVKRGVLYHGGIIVAVMRYNAAMGYHERCTLGQVAWYIHPQKQLGGYYVFICHLGVLALPYP